MNVMDLYKILFQSSDLSNKLDTDASDKIYARIRDSLSSGSQIELDDQLLELVHEERRNAFSAGFNTAYAMMKAALEATA